MSKNFLLKLSMELIAPSKEQLALLESLFKKSPSIVSHNIILHSLYSPAKVTYKRDDTIILLNELKIHGCGHLSKDAPPLYLK